MREGWEYKKLGEVCDIYQPNTISTEMLVNNGKYYVYGANGIIGKYNEFNHENSEILLTCRGATCGTINISEPYSWINGNAMVIHRKSDSLNFDFLKYLMSSLDYSLIITGAAQPQITRAKLTPVKICIPQLSTQLSIVSELDMITEMISKYDEQLKELDKLSQSIFYEMFGDPVENEKGWEVKTLKNISEKITSGNNANLATGTYKSEGIPYFRCQNVWKNRIDFKDMVYIDEETNQKLKSSVLKHNDLLITKIGRINTENSSLGRVSIYTGEDFQANLSGNLCFIRLLDTVNPIFVLNIMISNYFRDYIRRTTVGGTDKRALKSPQIGRFPIILPPLPLQQSFARKIEAIEAMKSKVKEAKKEAETLLAARMQYWFE